MEDWLDIGSATKLPNDQARGRAMAKRLDGTGRCWMCDGEYVYFRPSRANPATLSRHQNFLDKGHYKHLGTYDDVQVFELKDGSPFKRGVPLDMAHATIADIRRVSVLAACRRDWATYVDALEELSGRIKGAYHDNFAAAIWKDTLDYVEHLIALRGGPTRAERDRGVVTVRQRRGQSKGRTLYLPA